MATFWRITIWLLPAIQVIQVIQGRNSNKEDETCKWFKQGDPCSSIWRLVDDPNKVHLLTCHQAPLSQTQQGTLKRIQVIQLIQAWKTSTSLRYNLFTQFTRFKCNIPMPHNDLNDSSNSGNSSCDFIGRINNSIDPGDSVAYFPHIWFRFKWFR